VSAILKETLTYQLGKRPGTMFRDMSKSPTVDLIPSMKSFMANGQKAHPETHAIGFYLRNHIVALVKQQHEPNEPLSEGMLWLVDDYQRFLSNASARLFYYLLLICTRESRHVKNKFETWQFLEKEYGPECVLFTKSISGSGSTTSVEKFKDDPPDTQIGRYTAHLVDVFNKGSFSGGYGGKPWGKVAKVLNEFAHGRFSAEMMMDTGFTLCHNNGPIFNKGMLYTGYSSSSIKTILDVQSAGQIPELVATNHLSQFQTPKQKNYFEAATKVGLVFGEVIDWQAVEESGKGKYGQEKNEAAKMDPNYKLKMMELEKQKKLKLIAAAKIAAEKAKWELEIMPGVKVQKYERNKS